MNFSVILLTQQFITVCLFYTSFAQLHVVDIPNQGKIQGIEISKVRIQKIIAYYGIPYAQPPIGNRRFAPPETNPLPDWSDIKNNTDYQPSCLQVREDYKASELPFLTLLTDMEFPSNISEDCLYLNVFVPTGPPPQGFATIIWIHPGNFTTGMPSIWNPHTLVYRQRVIVVTFAWRLNIMGFFTTTDGEAPGNYGLMDQQAAMQWVKNNIKYFGGNPDNICVMGYGTGATSIGIHMINAESRNLFNRAIIMSSSLFQPSAYRYPEEDVPLIERVAKDFGCLRKPTSLLIDCLRRADANQLVQQTSNINWRPLIDKDLSNSTSAFLSEPPKNYFDRGEFAKIPILTGYTNMEHGLEFGEWDNNTVFSHETLEQLLTELISGDLPNINNTESSCSYNFDLLVDSVMFFYGPACPNYTADSFRKIATSFLVEKTYAASTIQMANYLSKDQPVYVYRFDMKPSSKVANKELPDWIKVPHLFDLTYVWGLPYWKPDQQEWDPRDKRIADTVMSFWTSFAKTSDPTQNTIYAIKWDAYSKDKPGLLIMDNNIYMSDIKSVNYKAFEFWNDYYPKVYQVAIDCCGSSDSSSAVAFDWVLHFTFACQLLYTF
ncbi:cholinesterase 1 [Anthonomus grandis grandis]|uniref:cholinesterase 1 n=1 Tax=Anthonomus grandis grandis TaxID=2921223 RepID=UPI0021659CEF|nr:cholinesterase 1 [Anthonomus grandis grandis]